MADDYNEKFEQFFSMVPKSAATARQIARPSFTDTGEVQAGSPIIPITSKADTAGGGEDQDRGGKNHGQCYLQDADKDLTHTKLLTNWKDGGIMTSCNAFVMKAGQAMGLPGLGGFNVEAAMAGLGKRHCWITPCRVKSRSSATSSKPAPRTPEKGYENLHVGISLYVEGDNWWTIEEGGQGGPAFGRR